MKDFLSSDRSFATAETEVTLNGKHFHLVTTCGRLDNGGAVLINIPINELVATRKELREKEEKANLASKLASIGQMAAGVAHEVNNPLTIIQGSAGIIASLIDEETLDRKNLRHYSDRIVDTSDRIARIIRSLRTLTRGGEQDPFSPVSLKALLGSCADISSHNLKRLEIELIVPELRKDIVVMGREVQLGQVLINLISNSVDAVKHLPERWIRIESGHKDGELCLEVSDSGNGIPPEIVEKLFDPFFTTKKTEGTGLGLHISAKIMEEHGGKIFYVTGREHTTFRLQFPTPKI